MFTTSTEFQMSHLWNFLWKSKGYSTKISKICSNIGNSKQQFESKFGPEIYKNIGSNALAVPILLYEGKSGPPRQKDKRYRYQSRWKFSEEPLGTPFLTQKGMKKFWKIWSYNQLTRN